MSAEGEDESVAESAATHETTVATTKTKPTRDRKEYKKEWDRQNKEKKQREQEEADRQQAEAAAKKKHSNALLRARQQKFRDRQREERLALQRQLAASQEEEQEPDSEAPTPINTTSAARRRWAGPPLDDGGDATLERLGISQEEFEVVLADASPETRREFMKYISGERADEAQVVSETNGYMQANVDRFFDRNKERSNNMKALVMSSAKNRAAAPHQSSPARARRLDAPTFKEKESSVIVDSGSQGSDVPPDERKPAARESGGKTEEGELDKEDEDTENHPLSSVPPAIEFSTGADGFSWDGESEATFDDFSIANTVQLDRSMALQDANRRNGRRQSMVHFPMPSTDEEPHDRSVPAAEAPPPRRSARKKPDQAAEVPQPRRSARKRTPAGKSRDD